MLEALSSGTVVVGTKSLNMTDYKSLYIAVDEDEVVKAILYALNDGELPVKARKFAEKNLNFKEINMKIFKK